MVILSFCLMAKAGKAFLQCNVMHLAVVDNNVKWVIKKRGTVKLCFDLIHKIFYLDSVIVAELLIAKPLAVVLNVKKKKFRKLPDFFFFYVKLCS